ncbi:MAG: class I SAM-dependent methyltransferase [Phaeospirillum sp.]|nr:class I SAM-dependent methyltransferase [Phaeospirillum sp.]
MKALSHHRSTCRLCGSPAVEMVVPLAPIPVATPNIGIAANGLDSLAMAATLVPLDLWLCRDCGHVQLLDIIDPEVHYNNFSYRTAISLGLGEHFKQMADSVGTRVNLQPGDLVVEVGSNDGTLLEPFQHAGATVLGIDPARETARLATERGIETLATFFTEELGHQIRARRGPAKVVVCTNTYANLDDIDGPTRGIRALMDETSLFVFETQHGADVIDRFLIDTIYHEHLSYFLVGPLVRFFRAHDMELVEVEHLPTKGGSFRGYVRLGSGTGEPSGSVAAFMAAEQAAGLHNPATYWPMSDRLTKARADLVEVIAHYRATGRPIAGYGASVGTVTLISQLNLAQSLDFIIDDKPLTEAIIGPDYRIPVVSPQALTERNPACVIILAWRYAEPIIARNSDWRAKGGRFIVPLPTLVEL